MLHMKRSSYSLINVLVIAKALNITDMNKIISFEMEEETEELFNEAFNHHLSHGYEPNHIHELIEEKEAQREEEDQEENKNAPTEDQ